MLTLRPAHKIWPQPSLSWFPFITQASDSLSLVNETSPDPSMEISSSSSDPAISPSFISFMALLLSTCLVQVFVSFSILFPSI